MKIEMVINDTSDIRKMDMNDIVIEQYGRTVVAKFRGIEREETAIAKCSPEDEFDFLTGAELALSRLKEKMTFKPYLWWEGAREEAGQIGEKTTMTLFFKEPLYVGDIVEVLNLNTDDIVMERVVYKSNGNYGIRGLVGLVFYSGISKAWQIRRVRSFKDVENGEVVNGLKYIKSKKVENKLKNKGVENEKI